MIKKPEIKFILRPKLYNYMVINYLIALLADTESIYTLIISKLRDFSTKLETNFLT